MPQSEQLISSDTPLARCCCFNPQTISYMKVFDWFGNECQVAWNHAIGCSRCSLYETQTGRLDVSLTSSITA